MNPSLDSAWNLYVDGRVGEAIEILLSLESRSTGDHLILQQIAELYLKCGQHDAAARCYSRSAQLQPTNAQYLYNLAASKTALGELDEAESLFTEVIRLDPKDYGAWLNRSGLKKQTVDCNHVEQLRFVKSRLDPEDPGQVQICYALAKELEDLGRHDESFAFLQEGSHRRRLTMTYDIAEDEAAMQAIASGFSKQSLRNVRPGKSAGRPIFILGLPRSGTTLADRIVSSHSRVDSLGEHNTLPLSVMALTHDPNARRDAMPPKKAELIRRSTRIDFEELGRRYLTTIDGFGPASERLTDKTPLNFLYIGLIRLAMPGARIIHMRRHPMDSCYAIYKTLFRAGYPFSYSLQETGRYHIAYRELMEHWRQALPGGFLDVDYEALVADPGGVSRRIIDYLGLEWEDDCLRFHQRGGAAATASAAQVRQPIYYSSVGLWRKYAKQLAPLAGKLSERGIRVD